MGDVVGRLFREFAVTLAITILISAVVSLTLGADDVGALAEARPARGGPSAARRTRFAALADSWRNGFARLIDRYDGALRWVLDHQRPVLVVAVATLVLTVLLYIVIPKGLFPTQDTGQMQARVARARVRVVRARWREIQQAIAEQILADPDVETLAARTSASTRANNTMLHTGRMLINLKPHGERGAPRTSWSACGPSASAGARRRALPAARRRT